MEEDVPTVIPDGVKLWVRPQHTGGEIESLP